MPRAQLARQRSIEGVTVRERAVIPLINDECLDTRGTCAVEPTGIGAIRDDDGDPRREPMLLDRIDERLEIAAPAGDEDANRRALPFRRRDLRHTRRPRHQP